MLIFFRIFSVFCWFISSSSRVIARQYCITLTIFISSLHKCWQISMEMALSVPYSCRNMKQCITSILCKIIIVYVAWFAKFSKFNINKFFITIWHSNVSVNLTLTHCKAQKSRGVCETLQYAPGGNKVEKAIYSFKVKVNVARSLTLVSFERASLVEYACQIWSLYLLRFKSYSEG